MKQTAVQYLIEEMQQRIPTFYAHYVMNMYEVYNKALEMEKEQMHKCASFWRGKENAIEKPIFEHYYKETYETKTN